MLYCCISFMIFLQDFVKYNESHLRELPCQILDPILLGEGAGVGLMKGVDSKEIPEGSTLYDLVQMGIKQTHASVSVVVRLRKELSLVKDIPVLIAIDQVSTSFNSSFISEIFSLLIDLFLIFEFFVFFLLSLWISVALLQMVMSFLYLVHSFVSATCLQYNNWFTFSEYEEPVTIRSTRPVHARELAMVSMNPLHSTTLLQGYSLLNDNLHKITTCYVFFSEF